MGYITFGAPHIYIYIYIYIYKHTATHGSKKTSEKTWTPSLEDFKNDIIRGIQTNLYIYMQIQRNQTKLYIYIYIITVLVCCIDVIYIYIYIYTHTHTHIYTHTHGNKINNNDERTHFFRKIYLSHFIRNGCERWVRDCNILTQVPLSLAVPLFRSAGLLDRWPWGPSSLLGLVLTASNCNNWPQTNWTCMWPRVI